MKDGGREEKGKGKQEGRKEEGIIARGCHKMRSGVLCHGVH